MKRWMMVGLVMAAFGLSACGAKQSPGAAAPDGVYVVHGEVTRPYYDTGVLVGETLVHSQESGVFTEEPSLVIEVTETTQLEIVARAQVGDLVLSVTGPGLPLFNDDTYGLDPAISKTFAPGRYEVRVGVWSGTTEDYAYELIVRAPVAALVHPDGGGHDHHGHDHHHGYDPYGHSQFESMDLDLSAEPALGTLTAESFAEGTQYASLQAEGTTLARVPGIYHLSRALFSVDPSALGDEVANFLVRASYEGQLLDSVIVIVDANGEQHFVDDTVGLDAGGMLFADSGVVHVFAGVYSGVSEGQPVDYAVVMSRGTSERDSVETASVRLRDAVIHHSVTGSAFGSMNDWEAEGCWGVVRDAEAPDLRVQVTDTRSSLVFRALSLQDAFLAVRTPSGELLCNDDAEGFNARVNVLDTEEGSYEVWGGAVGSHGQQANLQPTTQIRTVIEVKRGLAMGSSPSHSIGMEGFEIQTLTHTNRRTESVMGNADICGGALTAHMDLSRPTAVLENTTSEAVVALVRSHGPHPTALFTINSAGLASCAVGDLGNDAYDGQYLQPGERMYVWAGSVNEADAQKPFELRTVFFDDAHADIADELLEP